MKYLPLVFILSCAPAHLEQEVNRLSRSIQDIRATQADQVAQITALNERISSLQSNVEDLSHKASSARASVITPALPTISPPAIVPLSVLERDEIMFSNYPASIKSAFDEGFMQLRAGAFGGALPIFKSLSERTDLDIDSKVSALFWLGVTYDGLNEFRNSITTYGQIISGFSSHSKVPLALLRQAGAVEKMGDSKAVDVILRKLIQDHPQSIEAKIANDRLKNAPPPRL
jgi:TolA-binding protein